MSQAKQYFDMVQVATTSTLFDCLYQVWYGFVALRILKRDGMDDES